MILFYVDSIILLSRKDCARQAARLKADLKARHEMRGLGPVKWFLGVRIIPRSSAMRGLSLSRLLRRKVVHKYHLTNHKAPSTPLPPDDLELYELKATPQQICTYQGKVGPLQFAASVTRPDVERAAEFLSNPGPQHMAAIDQALTYLYATRFHAIEYGP